MAYTYGLGPELQLLQQIVNCVPKMYAILIYSYQPKQKAILHPFHQPASQSFIQSCQFQDGWELSRTNGLLCIFRQSRKVSIHPSTLTAAIAPLESKLKKEDHDDDYGEEKDYAEDDYAGGEIS